MGCFYVNNDKEIAGMNIQIQQIVFIEETNRMGVTCMVRLDNYENKNKIMICGAKYITSFFKIYITEEEIEKLIFHYESRNKIKNLL